MKPHIAHVTTIDASLYALLSKQLVFLQNAGYQVTGISTPGNYLEEIAELNIRHIPVRMARGIAPLQDLRSLWRLYQVFRRERFTIVHTHNPKPGLIGQMAARLAGVPIIINTLHGFYFHEHMRPVVRRFFILLEMLAACFSDLILSQNQEDIDTAINERICSAEKIRHLGNGIDLSVFDPSRISTEDAMKKRVELSLPADAPVVGFVGRLSARRKGFLDFLAAARRLHEQCPDARFLIVGIPDRGRPDSVDPETAAEYDIADVCLFLGWQDNNRLPLLYSIMDVIVLPSLFEGIPRVVMEAAAMKTPAIVTNVKGNREAVMHGINGLLVPLGDSKALAEAMYCLVTDPERARLMGEEGRRIALEKFDERLVCKKTLAEYQRLLTTKRLMNEEIS